MEKKEEKKAITKAAMCYPRRLRIVAFFISLLFTDGGDTAKNRLWELAAFPLNSSLKFFGTDEDIVRQKIDNLDEIIQMK